MSGGGLQQHISSAVWRLNLLRRRENAHLPEPPKTQRQVVEALTLVVEELKIVQQQLSDTSRDARPFPGAEDQLI